MAHELHRPGLQVPLRAASQLFPKEPVVLVQGASGVLRVIRAGSSSIRPFGFTGLAGASAGHEVAVYEEGNYVKAIAAASLGFGAELVVASIGVATLAASAGATVAMLGPATTTPASGGLLWAAGIAFENAAVGETFTVFVKPRLVSGGLP